MAKKPFDGSINRHTADFSKAGPKGEPASGLSIQRYIKSIDNSKFGAGMTTPDGGEHLFFVDAEDMQTYIDDPTREDLILDRVQLEVQYTMSATLLSESFAAVKLGSVGNYIEYTFETMNKNGQIVSEPVTVTYTISRGSTTKVITETYIAGTTARFGVDSHLLEGTNNISIRVKGNLTNVSTLFGVTYQVINLELSDNFNIATVNVIESQGQTIGIPYQVSGTGTKTMEWYLDGEKLPYSAIEDEILDTTAERTKYIQIDGLEQGMHSIQFRAKILVGGEAFYSDTLYREIIVSRQDSTANPVVVLATTIPAADGIVTSGQGVTIHPTQYVPFELRVATWNPKGTYKNTVDVSVDGTVMSSVECTEGDESSMSLIFGNSGEKACTLSVGETVREVSLSVEATSIKVKEIDDNLLLSFQADGRNNSAVNKDSWTDGTHTATFNGFNWTETSGWVNGNLLIPSDTSIGFDFAPLGNNPTANGRTIEFEFKTVDVENDDATLIDLMSVDAGNPVGMKLTATELSVRSRGGSSVSRRFKTDENLRMSIVINTKAGSTNKLLLFVYINGIISMVDNFDATDSFQSPVNLVIGGHDAGILLKQIKVYDAALSSDQILNNWILYRDTIEEMTSIYDKNDLYETGTSNFDLNKIAKYLPVMVLTGDMKPINEAKDNKATTWMDVEYTNLQNPEYSFKMVHAQMRPQGTSSLTYPRKNLRLYTNKSDETIVYDSEGKVVADKLYAFKPKAQRVWCWTLKADFAESSSTHNTGVARIWNDVMRTAQVNGEYVLRTQAQQAAVDNDYNYDVRTTVDGFPIVIFWHETEDQPLTFLGKYNFNNDKSTESVFGFCGIPGFNDSSVQCWEFRDSGYDLALFKTPVDDPAGYTTYAEKFDAYSADYSNLFTQVWESRYPDTNTPDYAPLRRLALWLNSTEDDLQEWKDNKSQYFDLYKLAAYYVYLMRFGAVDQTVKNAMLTTEDGIHWYFINYDNDTILGVRNDGLLRFGPEIDRQSPDPELGGYAYAGHNSVLWNNFEADPECMELVKIVDSALFSAGLTYNNMIKMFNEEQAGKWSEKVYNDDAQYKYLDPYIYNNQPYLGSLQGSRSDHRKWWISNRFANMDAKYGNAAYTSNTISLLIPNAPIGSTFSITSGKDFFYGYGQNRMPVEIGVYIEKDATHTFTTNMNFEIGTPLQIYAPQYIKELDLSGLIEYIGAQNFAMNNAFSETLGSKMKSLILGVNNTITDLRRNNALSDISSIADITTLEYLNVAGYQALRTLNLSTLVNLKTLKAKASGLTSVTFAPGAPVTLIELPNTMQSITLNNLMDLETSGVVVEQNFKNVISIDVRRCPKISNTPNIILNWMANKDADNENCSVYMDNVDWEDVSPETIMSIAQIKADGGSLTLRGTCRLTSANPDIVDYLKSVFGPNVFNEESEFCVKAPDSVFVIGPTSVLEGESAQYSTVIFSEHPGTVRYSLSGSRTGVSLDPITGLLTTTENNNVTATMTIMAIHTPAVGEQSVVGQLNVQVIQRTYPDSTSKFYIGGDPTFGDESSPYTLSYTNSAEYTGLMDAVWSLSGDIVNYAYIDSSNNNQCIIKKRSDVSMSEASAQGTLSLQLKKTWNNGNIGTVTKSIAWVNENVAISKLTNQPVMQIMYNNGLAANQNYMTKEEAAAVTESDFYPNGQTNSIFYNSSSITSFEEFQYFTGLTSVPNSCFCNCRNLTIITLPQSIVSIGDRAFEGCENLCLPDFPQYLASIGQYAFYNCFWIYSSGNINFVVPSPIVVNLPKYITYIGKYAFSHNKGNAYISKVVEINFDQSSLIETISTYAFSSLDNITSITIPQSVKYIEDYAFYYCKKLKTLQLSNNIESLGNYSFGSDASLESIQFDGTFTSIPNNCFYYCKSIEEISIPDTVTSIGSGAFDNCINLNTVNIGFDSSLNSIGEYAFRDCSSLENINLPNGLTSIQSGAFSNTALKSIHIPASCTDLANSTITGSSSSDYYQGSSSFGPMRIFENCPLENITVDENNEVWRDGRDGGGSNCIILRSDIPTSYPSTLRMYNMSGILTRGSKNTVLPSYVSYLGCYCFSGCTGLTEFVMPNRINYMGSNAFKNCTNLEHITLSKNIPYIRYECFCNCTSLESINIPSGVNSIMNDAFKNCSSLSEITVDPGNSYFTDGRDNEGSNCVCKKESNYLRLVVGCKNTVIPNNVKRIDSYAFCGATGLTSITFPDCEIEYISENAFYNTGLTSITIPSTVKTIQSYVFGDCKNLKTATIGASTLYGYVFGGCTNLETVNFTGNSNTISISEYAFSSSSSYGANAIKLKSININCKTLNITGSNSSTVFRFTEDSNITPSLTIQEGFESFTAERQPYILNQRDGAPSQLTLPSTFANTGAVRFRIPTSTEIVSLNTTPPTITNNTFADVEGYNSPFDVYVPAESVDTYKAASVWSNTSKFSIHPIPTT